MGDLILSDVHLRGKGDPRQSQFVRFMEAKAPEVENLFIAGDLLDLWFGMKPILVREYYPERWGRHCNLNYAGVTVP
ncbi:MAG: hypothetical protein HYT87_08015 [Nitrospirae bacterium]|nr:hypothetical protein [Nitrospirota bacterium]